MREPVAWHEQLCQWTDDGKISGFALMSTHGRVEKTYGKCIISNSIQCRNIVDIFRSSNVVTHLDVEVGRLYMVRSNDGSYVAVSRGRQFGVSIHYLDNYLILVVCFIGRMQHRHVPLVTSLFDPSI